MKKFKSIKLLQQRHQIDIVVAIIAIVFSLFGILMIFEASNVLAFHNFGDKYHFVKDQLIWFFIGLGGMLITSIFPYKKYYYWSFPLILATIVFLFLVFIPTLGIKAYGASRWIGYKSFSFQPSELAKLTLIFYLSAWFSEKEKGRFIPFFLLLSLIVGLVVMQPDLGTAIILTTIAILMYFLSGPPLKHFLLLIPTLLVAVLVLSLSSPYRLRRFTTFLDPNADPLGASYHIQQILISLGSGGFWGLGLGASRQKYQFLPEATTDSIYAIIGEELGFVGGGVLIILYMFFLYKIFHIAKKAADRQGFLLAGGIFILFAAQVAINLGSMVALLPLTGVPLPFISYGGSNLVISLIATGIVLNISKSATA